MSVINNTYSSSSTLDVVQVQPLNKYAHAQENIATCFNDIFDSQQFQDKEKLEGWKPFVLGLVKKYQESPGEVNDVNTMIHIATLNERIIGYIVAFLKKNEHSAYVPVFAVHKAFHGKSVGSKLMNALFEKMSRYPNSTVSLHCLANDKKVVRFYRSRPELCSEKPNGNYSSGEPKLEMLFKVHTPKSCLGRFNAVCGRLVRAVLG